MAEVLFALLPRAPGHFYCPKCFADPGTFPGLHLHLAVGSWDFQIQRDPLLFRACSGSLAFGTDPGPTGPVRFVEFYPSCATTVSFSSDGRFAGRVAIPTSPIGLCQLGLRQSSATVRITRPIGAYLADVGMEIGANRTFATVFQHGNRFLGCQVNINAVPEHSFSSFEWSRVASRDIYSSFTCNLAQTGMVAIFSNGFRLGSVAVRTTGLVGRMTEIITGYGFSAKVRIPGPVRMTIVGFCQEKRRAERMVGGIGMGVKSWTGEKMFAGFQFREKPVVQLTVRKRLGNSSIVASLLLDQQLNVRFRLGSALHVNRLLFNQE
jgi:hypothetical protein